VLDNAPREADEQCPRSVWCADSSLSHALKICGTQFLLIPYALKPKRRTPMRLHRNQLCPIHRSLSCCGGDPKSEKPQATRHSASRGCTAPEGIPRTPLERGNAEAARQKDNHPEQQMRSLWCRVHRLRRHRSRSYKSARHGRRLARRSPG